MPATTKACECVNHTGENVRLLGIFGTIRILAARHEASEPANQIESLRYDTSSSYNPTPCRHASSGGAYERWGDGVASD
jgi:hypothetical protein